ncbi:ccr4 associated factor [Coemansia sp. RSA 2523]|nr:ccr4 associated factor [Coemansia sp. RSA 2523]
MLRTGVLRRVRTLSRAIQRAQLHTVQVDRLTDFEHVFDSTNQFAAVGNRAVLKVSGLDAREFLQGMQCNDMESAHNGGMLTGFLSPQGRILADAFIYALPESSYLVEVDTRVRERMQRMLGFYRLRARVEISDVSNECNVWQVWGPQSPHLSFDGVAHMADTRAPHMGVRVVGTSRPPAFSDFDEQPSTLYELRRILKGVAEGANDFVDASLPLECNLDYMQGVHFGKGCYVGQELTIRTHHRGVVRKRIVPVLFSPVDHGLRVPLRVSDEWAPELAQRDVVPSGARARRPGRVGSTAGNAGLALMRVEHVEQFATQTDNQMHFEAECADGQRVRVSPWLPSWWPKQ